MDFVMSVAVHFEVSMAQGYPNGPEAGREAG